MTMIAEIPNCLWVPADPSRYLQRPQAQEGGNVYRLVVIHITSGHADPMGTANMWSKPPDRSKGEKATAAHGVTGQDGTCIQCVPLRFSAQHAHKADAYSVGWEHCVREPGEFGPNDPGMPPTTALYAGSAKIVAYLLKAAGLLPTRDFVKGHAEADPLTTHTGCPNAGPWNWDYYMGLVASEYAALPTPAPPVS